MNVRRNFLVAAILAGLVGCADGGDDPAGVDDPRLETLTNQVDFGVVAVGTEATRQSSVGNAGGSPLTIVAIGIRGDAGFSVRFRALDVPASGADTTAPTDVGVRLEPGANEPLFISYAPLSQEPASARLVIVSNDPAAPETTIELRAGPP